MKGEQRNLDGKCQKKAEEQPLGGSRKLGYSPAHNLVANHHKVKATGMRVKPQDRCQHEHRADHGVHEEFHCGINFALMAENSDKQSHRYQRGLPEEVEEEQIEGGEDPDQSGFQNQEQDKEFFYP